MSVRRKGKNHFLPVRLPLSSSSYFPGQRESSAAAVSSPQPRPLSLLAPVPQVQGHPCRGDSPWCPPPCSPGSQLMALRTLPNYLYRQKRLQCRICLQPVSVPLQLALLSFSLLFFSLSSFLLCCFSFPSLYFFPTPFKKKSPLFLVGASEFILLFVFPALFFVSSFAAFLFAHLSFLSLPSVSFPSL